MPRRRPPKPSPTGRDASPVSAALSARVESGPDGYPYAVRSVTGGRAVKSYRCPGCDHEIPPRVSHVVAWPADVDVVALEERRHWHSQCWVNRATRSPTRKWS